MTANEGKFAYILLQKKGALIVVSVPSLDGLLANPNFSSEKYSEGNTGRNVTDHRQTLCLPCRPASRLQTIPDATASMRY